MEMFKIWILPILQSILASFLYEGGKSTFKQLFRDNRLSKNRFDMQVEEIFYKTVDSCIVNDQIAQYVKNHDLKKYHKAIKDELLSGKYSFDYKSFDKNIYEAFKNELIHSPIFCMKLLVMYGKQCKEQNEDIQKEIQIAVEHSKAILKTTDEVKKICREISLRTGFSPSIETVESDNNFCPIPELYAPRTELIKVLKNRLIENSSILIHGSILSGKSITSCLLVNNMTKYIKKRIQFNYKNIINIEDLLETYDRHLKIVFVLDGIKYEDYATYEAFCQVIKRWKSENWLFIINSREKLTDWAIGGDTGIVECELPLMNEQEIKEMIPIDIVDKWGNFIFAQTSGHPLLAQMICSYLQSINWMTDASALEQILTFPKNNTTLETQLRKLMGNLIKDKDAQRLLNRLLLINGKFTDIDCNELAAINPLISNPLQTLDLLRGTWVIEDNNKYHVSPLLSKSLKVDLLDEEKKDCCYFMAQKIQKKQILDPTDVLNIFNLYIQANDYNKAGNFYVYVVTNLQENQLIEHKDFMIIRSIWIDLPLPEKMQIEIKVAIRITQIAFIAGIEKEAKRKYLIDDLKNLIDDLDEKSEIRAYAYYIISTFYIIEQDVENSILYKEKAFSISTQVHIDLKYENQDLWILLSSIKTEDSLFVWFEYYLKAGCPRWELYYEICNACVENIKKQVETDKIPDLMNRIIAKARKYDDKLYAFIVMASAENIDYYSDKNDWENVNRIYDECKIYLKYSIGKLLLNYAYGIALFNKDQTEKAEPYIQAACEIEDYSIMCMTSLYSHCTMATITSKNNTEEALMVMQKYVNNPMFMKSYVERERMQAIGTLAFAYWNAGKRKDAVVQMLILQDFLWKERNNDSDEIKSLLTRFSILIQQCLNMHKIGVFDTRFAVPDYGLFVKKSPMLLNVYDEVRFYSATYYLFELVEEYVKDINQALPFVDYSIAHYKSKATKHLNFAMLMLSYIPLCLLNNRIDTVEYIVISSGAGFKYNYEKEIDIENIVLVHALLEILIYRANYKLKGEYFDDENIYRLIDDFKQYTDKQKQSNLLEILMKQRSDVNYGEINDETIKTILYTFNIDSFGSRDNLIILERLYISMYTLNKLFSAGEFLADFTMNFAKFAVNKNPQDYDIMGNDLDVYFAKADRKTSYEKVRSVIRGLYYLMKNPPEMNKEMEEIIYE